MTDFVNFLSVNFLLTYISLIFSITPNMVDSKEDSDLKPLITSGYRMYSSVYTQHVVSIRVLKAIKYHGDNHLCGGAIISPNRILTAAHCIYTSQFGLIPAKAITISAGSPLRVTRTGDERLFNVSKAVFHPEYEINPVYADIAYLILSETIMEVHDVIGIAPLAFETPRANTLCTVAGWGRVFDGPMPDEILHVDLYIWDIKRCRSIHKKIRAHTICAGDLRDRGKGTCHGDSGGPLFCNGAVAGVVSYGIGCGWSQLSVDFYTDVASYVSWLNVAVKLRTCTKFLLLLIMAIIFLN